MAQNKETRRAEVAALVVAGRCVRCKETNSDAGKFKICSECRRVHNLCRDSDVVRVDSVLTVLLAELSNGPATTNELAKALGWTHPRTYSALRASALNGFAEHAGERKTITKPSVVWRRTALEYVQKTSKGSSR